MLFYQNHTKHIKKYHLVTDELPFTAGPILRIFSNAHMASAGVRAYDEDLGAEAPAGVQEAKPPVGSQGAKAPKADEVFCLKQYNFQWICCSFA